jgi:hypothetical protein
MEDKKVSQFVALGEYCSSNYTLDRFESTSSRGGRLIRVVLKAYTHPQALLPYPVVDTNGTMVCRTLGEAFQRELPVWWMEVDAVATCEDGATHTP